MSGSIGRVAKRKAKREIQSMVARANRDFDPSKPLIFQAHGGYEHIGCGGAAYHANRPGLASCDKCERIVGYDELRRI